MRFWWFSWFCGLGSLGGVRVVVVLEWVCVLLCPFFFGGVGGFGLVVGWVLLFLVGWAVG